jgi:hypothetical protein
MEIVNILLKVKNISVIKIAMIMSEIIILIEKKKMEIINNNLTNMKIHIIRKIIIIIKIIDNKIKAKIVLIVEKKIILQEIVQKSKIKITNKINMILMVKNKGNMEHKIKIIEKKN